MQPRRWIRPAGILVAILGAMFLLRGLGVTEYLSEENIGALRDRVDALGVWGPAVYIVVYILGCLLFLPGLALTLVSGIFGVAMGTVYVSIASTTGAALSFLLARTALRPVVERWAEDNPAFRKIDDGVEEHGWRMVMITRLVPLFPFNLQNYAYGLTKVSFPVYVGVSWLCMLPGTVAYVAASGSIISGEGDVKKTLAYLGVAAIFFVVLSLIPSFLKRKYNVAGESDGETVSPPAGGVA